MLNKLSIKARFGIIAAMVLLALIVTTGMTLKMGHDISHVAVEESGKALFELQQQKVKVAVHSMAVSIGNALNGVENEASQLHIIRQNLNGIRYEKDESGYFFANKGTETVFHINKDLWGKDMAKVKDKNGVMLFQDMLTAAKKGGGFVEYVWDKPGKGLTPKLSYAEMIPGTDFWVGTGVYIDNIEASTKAMDDLIMGVEKTLVIEMVIFSVIAFIVIFVIGAFIAVGVVNTILGITDSLKDIAEGEGDLTKRIPVKGKDELTELSTWFNTFIGKLQDMIKALAADAKQITAATVDLDGLAEKSDKTSSDASAKANSVAVAAEEMNTTFTSIAAAMEQSSANANMVATSAEEMTATIGEISVNVENTNALMGEAKAIVEVNAEVVEQLRKAIKEINAITDGITEIAEQTNLLALNATIEAARAGEAGKGFAVVAAEIKDLASRTAELTDQATENIEKVNGFTKSTTDGFSDIAKSAEQVAMNVNTIASSITEQSAATGEIVNNMSSLSAGIDEVTQNVNEGVTVVSTITQDIATVNDMSTDISNSSNDVRKNVVSLKALADKLNKLVGSFSV